MASPSTPAPSLSTRPTASCPGTSGNLGSGNSPSTMWRSVRQTPQAEIRTGTSPAPGACTPRSSSSSGCPTRLNAIARTMYVNQRYLHIQILPYFAGRQITDIERQDVRTRFASRSATPVAADRSMPVLSVIMREAEAMGYRSEGSNPCRGIRRCRRKARERFLSDDESGGNPAVGGRIFPGDLPNAAQARSAEPSEAADGWMATNRSSVQPLS